MTPVVAAVVLAAGLAPAQAGPPALKWKLAKGDTFYVKAVTATEQTVEVAGNKMDLKQDQTVVQRYKVTDAGADGVVLEQTIVKAEIEGTVPGLAGLADKMKGATLTFTLDPKFKVTKVAGLDEYAAKLGGDDEMGKAVAKAVASEAAVKLGVESLFAVAGTPAKVGDTWRQDAEMSLGPLGNLALATTYRYDGQDGGLAKVSSKSDATYTAPAGDAGGLPFKISKGDLKADEFTGAHLFDVAAGRLKESTGAAKIAGTLTISVNGQEVEIGTTQTIKTTATVSDKNLADD